MKKTLACDCWKIRRLDAVLKRLLDTAKRPRAGWPFPKQGKNNMGQAKKSCNVPSQSVERFKRSQHLTQAIATKTLVFTLCILLPSLAFLYFLTSELDKGQVIVNLTLKIPDYLELQAEITKTAK